MVSAVAKVTVTPKLLMSVTVETIGKVARYELREGSTLTDLVYDNNGVEETVSGVCKKFNFAFIQLPASNSCEHDTTSMFAAQVVIQSMVLDCSSEFKSDIRTISVYNIRSIGEVTDATEEPLPPAPDETAEILRVVISGDLDVETGVIANPVITITFNEELESIAAIKAGLLTITGTKIKSKNMSELTVVNSVEDGMTVLKVSGVDDIDMVELKKEVAIVTTLVAGDKTMKYTLTEDDYPNWDVSQIPMKVTVVEATQDYILFALVNAPAEPDFVVLNEDHVLNTVTKDVDQPEGGYIVRYKAGMEDHTCKTTGNIITVVGPEYSAESETFDGPEVVPVEDAVVEESVDEAVADSLNAVIAGSMESAFDKLYAELIPVLPEDVDVSSVKIGSDSYDANATIDITDVESGSSIISPIFDDKSTTGVGVNALALLTSADPKDGHVDVTVTTSKVTLGPVRRVRTVRGGVAPIASGTPYEFHLTNIAPTELLTLEDVTIDAAPEGYTAKAIKMVGTSVMVTRNHMAPKVHVDLGVEPNTPVVVKARLGEYDTIYVVKADTSGIVLPGIYDDAPVEEPSAVTHHFEVIVPEQGRCDLVVNIISSVAEDLAVEKIAISGDLGRDGNIDAPVITVTFNRDVNAEAAKTMRVNFVGVYEKVANELGTVATEGSVVTITGNPSNPIDITKFPCTEVIVKIGDTVLNPEPAVVEVPDYRVPFNLKKITISGTPDQTGKIEKAKFTFTYEGRSLPPINEMKYSCEDLEITEHAIGSMPTIQVTAEGDTSISVNEANLMVNVLEGKETLTASAFDGFWNTEYTMQTGEFPKYQTPMAAKLQSVKLTGTANEHSGKVTDGVVTMVFDVQPESLAGCKLSISKLEITDKDISACELTSETVTLNGVEATLKTSYAGDVEAVVNDGMWDQKVTMTEGDSGYPKFVTPLIEEVTFNEIAQGENGAINTGNIIVKMNKKFAVDCTSVKLTITEMGITEKDMTKEGDEANSKWKLDLSGASANAVKVLDGATAPEKVTCTLAITCAEQSYSYTYDAPKENETAEKKYPVWNEPALALKSVTLTTTPDTQTGALTSGTVSCVFNHQIRDYEGTDGKLTITALGITDLALTTPDHITYTGNITTGSVAGDAQTNGADAKVTVNSKEYTLHITKDGGFPTWSAPAA